MAEVEAVQIIAESLKQQVRQRAVDEPSFFGFHLSLYVLYDMHFLYAICGQEVLSHEVRSTVDLTVPYSLICLPTVC